MADKELTTTTTAQPVVVTAEVAVARPEPMVMAAAHAEKEKFLTGTSLCGCSKHKSPVDGESHCFPRYCLACWCSCFSIGRLYSVMEDENDGSGCKFLGLGVAGWIACVAFILLVALFGLGFLFPIFIAAGLAEKYRTKSPSGSQWCSVYCKSLYCFPCFLVQLRNFAELQEHKKQATKPADQLHMV